MTMIIQKSGPVKPVGTTKKHELLPDFLIIGAGKSGTTSLDQYLKQHPEIFIPKLKEPNFFGYERSKIEDFNNDLTEIHHFKNSVTNLEDYLRLFAEARSSQIKGETSNTYLYHKDAPERIKYYNPDVKLIAILRHPAKRLYSRYLHLVRENRVSRELGNDFSSCLDKQSIWWRRNDLVKEGFYFKNLSPFYSLFPDKNIRVFLYEELNDHPKKVMHDIYQFLGVDPDFKTDLGIKYNQSGIARNQILDKMYGRKGWLPRTAKFLLPKNAIAKLKNNSMVRKLFNTLREKNMVRPEMDPEIQQKLTHDVYREDIMKLQALIGKDLTHWLK